jgi:predicted Zn-dependent protease
MLLTALQKGDTWTQTRYRVSEFHAHRREFDHARAECIAITKALPYSFQPSMRIADLFVAEGRPADAVAEYRHSIAIEENPYGHMKLGVLLLHDSHAPDAIQELERGFSVDAQQHGIMTAEENAQGRSLLALGYARIGKVAKAKENARLALALQPGLRDAADLLRRLPEK